VHTKIMFLGIELCNTRVCMHEFVVLIYTKSMWLRYFSQCTNLQADTFATTDTLIEPKVYISNESIWSVSMSNIPYQIKIVYPMQPSMID
jgi:hypothetical protein